MKMTYFIISLLLVLAARNSAAYSGGGYAAPGVYGPVSRSNVAVFGSPGWKVCYSAEQVNTAGTLLCCQVKGYMGTTEIWYGIGCSNSGAVTSCVSWGNNAAYPEIKCSGTPFGTMYKWSC